LAGPDRFWPSRLICDAGRPKPDPTRLAALAQIPILIGAIIYVWLPEMPFFEQRQNLEFSALVLFLLTLIFVYGAGRFSVDYLITRKESRQPQAHSAA